MSQRIKKEYYFFPPRIDGLQLPTPTKKIRSTVTLFIDTVTWRRERQISMGFDPLFGSLCSSFHERLNADALKYLVKGRLAGHTQCFVVGQQPSLIFFSLAIFRFKNFCREIFLRSSWGTYFFLLACFRLLARRSHIWVDIIENIVREAHDYYLYGYKTIILFFPPSLRHIFLPR